MADHLTATGIGRGAGAVGTNSNDRYNANSWNTPSLDPTAYFEFSLTPDTGYLVNFTSFTYTGQRSSTGPTSFAFRSSLDTFSSNVGSPSATGGTISLAADEFQSVDEAITFRLFAWNTTNAGGTFSVNDFTFDGAVTAVPEPGTYAFGIGLLVVAVVITRRRQLAV
ncbi:MAG: hypothetical protein WA771_09630 [Chthoniobacterales bacterium]